MAVNPDLIRDPRWRANMDCGGAETPDLILGRNDNALDRGDACGQAPCVESSQSARTRVTASGCSMAERYPQSSMNASLEPGTRAAMA
jgi:hypothetical protein